LIAVVALVALVITTQLAFVQGIENPASDKLYVVTTLPVIADIVQNVAGERAVVESLVRPGINVVSYKLKPSDSEKIAKSTLFLYVGYGGEAVLGSYAEGIRNRSGVVRLLDEVIQSPAQNPNPYFWLDPTKAEVLARKVAAMLMKLDPEGSKEYETNMKRYSEALGDLDKWIASQIERLPPERRKLVTVSNTMPYFAARYNLEVVGYVKESAGTYEPQTRAVTELFERVVAEGVPTVFVEYEEAATTLREVIEVVAEEADVKVSEFIYTESLAPEQGVHTYIDMMRKNTELVVTALSDTQKSHTPADRQQLSIFEHPLLRPFKYEFMRRGSISLILVVAAASLVGTFAVLRGWAVFGDALSHGAILGLVAAYLFTFDFFLGALAAGLAVALAVSSVERRTKLRTDVIIGVTFTSMLALAIAVLSYTGGATLSIEDILFADVTAVSQEMMLRTILLSSAVIAFALILRRVLLIYTVDPLAASALGIRTGAVHYGLLLLLAVTVISAFMTIGAIPAVASLIIPPAAAFLVSKSPSEFMAKSITIAVISAVLGLYVSYYVGTNAGAAAVLMTSVFFMASVAYKSLRGA